MATLSQYFEIQHCKPSNSACSHFLRISLSQTDSPLIFLMIILITSWGHEPEDHVKPDHPEDSGTTLEPLWKHSGITISFLSSLGFLLSERTSGVSPVIFSMCD